MAEASKHGCWRRATLKLTTGLKTHFVPFSSSSSLSHCRTCFEDEDEPMMLLFQTTSYGLLASFPTSSGKLSAITAQLVAAAEIQESRPCGNPLCIVG